jgi:hypothetical protein
MSVKRIKISLIQFLLSEMRVDARGKYRYDKRHDSSTDEHLEYLDITQLTCHPHYNGEGYEYDE